MVDHGAVIRRHELSDAEWTLVGPLLARSGMGRPRLDDRTVLNGIVCCDAKSLSSSGGYNERT